MIKMDLTTLSKMLTSQTKIKKGNALTSMAKKALLSPTYTLQNYTVFQYLTHVHFYQLIKKYLNRDISDQELISCLHDQPRSGTFTTGGLLFVYTRKLTTHFMD